MTSVKIQHTFDISTDTGLGGSLENENDHSSLTVHYRDPILIPEGAFNARIQVDEVTLWNTVPNISEKFRNNAFTIRYHIDARIPVEEFNVKFPDGLYDVLSLQSKLIEIWPGGSQKIPPSILEIIPDRATQSIKLKVRETKDVIDKPTLMQKRTSIEILLHQKGFADILGFDRHTRKGFQKPGVYPGARTARFNTMEYFKIHSDFGSGIRINGMFDHTLTRVNITKQLGRQIVYTPNHPSSANVDELVGHARQQIRFWVTDHKNRRVPMPDPWSARLTLTYYQMIQQDPIVPIDSPVWSRN